MSRVAEPDDFDRIVEGLDLDFSFPDDAPVADVAPPQRRDTDDEQLLEPEVPFYREVDPTPLVPRNRGTLVGWIAVLGTPIALAVLTVFHVILSRPMLACAALVFVAGAIYLIAQLPERGPAHPDWPDDGAVL